MILRRLGLWWLMFALVAVQTLGLLHQVAHLPSHSGVAGQAAVRATDGLFSGHEADTTDCRLYDSLSHTDLLSAVPAVALPTVVPVAVLQFFQGESLARWAALFDARGPPSVR